MVHMNSAQPHHAACSREMMCLCATTCRMAPEGQGAYLADCSERAHRRIPVGSASLCRSRHPPRRQLRIAATPPTRPIGISLQRSILQRLALRSAVGADGAAAAGHHLHKLRRLGSALATTTTTLTSLQPLEGLVIPGSWTVRLHDVEGRMLSVESDAAESLSCLPCISSLEPHVDATRLLVKVLHDPPAVSSGTHILGRDDIGDAPCWRRYATAVALYIALADAGYCDQGLPFLSIQRVDWKELLRSQMYLRLDLMSSGATRSMRRPNFSSSNDKTVPVALLHPIAMKGRLRRLCVGQLPPSLTTEPFTDAEVFQLFYLQLVFRSVCDVRFPGMMFGENNLFVRSDLIGVRACRETQPLAFQHPSCSDRWLLFPSQSKILHFVSLEEAVIPRYASPERRCETVKQRLFGATPLLPCQGSTGRMAIIGWAAERVIGSPEAAAAALEELFALFDEPYGVTRREVWQAPIAPRIYRCGNASLTHLWKKNSDLSFLFARPPPQRPSPTVDVGRECQAGELLPDEEEEEKKNRGEEDAVVQRWRQYVRDGNHAVFEGTTDGIEVGRFLGKGGSSLVYEGCHGPQRLPVAVKCLIIPDGMDNTTYVRESLSNVAFLVLFNQLEACGIVKGARIYDFIVSCTPPKGMPEEDVYRCSSGAAVGGCAKLCYLVTGLMDGVVGRFLREEEEDFDPCYDTLVNIPFCDGEVFQFLYTQLVLRALFDCTIMDMMLNGQLRGDNLGYSHVARHETDTSGLLPSYKGIIVIFQSVRDASPRYLRFLADTHNADAIRPFSFICFIDLGQGRQPDLQELAKRGLIGETIVESCIQDDGFGRYWPLDRLYSQYVETCGAVARAAVEWGANLSVDSPQAAEAALQELFELFFPMYGVEAPTVEELASHAVFEWTPTTVMRLQRCCVYRRASQQQ